ncbi:hypothetical protein FPV67DRAFT_1677733 [Lyophyllum atratum]|nr:hypothetical protein FPV67DRAFT_1677733 [Lyophyllum atratum]
MPSPTGSASIVGIAILENPRPEPITLKNGTTTTGKSIVFDAQFYVNPSTTIVACLRYFNANDLAFGDIGHYFVYTTVAKMVKGANIHSRDLGEEDYHLVGDIQFLMPADVDDLRVQPYVDICGLPKNIDRNDAAFDIHAPQYTAALRENRDDSVFPARALIPDSPRYNKNNKKPVPSANTYVHIRGFIKRMEQDDAGRPIRFFVDVDNITFLGHPTTPAQSESPTTPDKLGKRKLRGSFDTPSPFASKRRKNDGAENIPPA